jgi:hypothetical protein
LIWKIYNENTDNKKLELELEFYFDLKHNYKYDSIKFNFDFNKNIKMIGEKNLTYFTWKGSLLPYEIMTINSVFPMIFNNCRRQNFSYFLLILGSLFIIFLILSIYLIIKNIINDFY